MNKKNSIHKTIILSDIHWEIRHKKAVINVTKFIKDYKPNHVVLSGDIYDNCLQSKFQKKKTKKIVDLGDEVKDSKSWLDEICKASKKVTFRTGNHEERLDRLQDREPGLPESLLEWENIFKHYQINEKLKVFTPKEADGFLRIGQAAIKHGHLYSLHQAWLNLSKYHPEEKLVIQCHSHRPAIYYWRDRISIVNGHLSDKKLQGFAPHAEWSMGFTVVLHYNNFRNFNAYLVHVNNNGSFCYQGRIY